MLERVQLVLYDTTSGVTKQHAKTLVQDAEQRCANSASRLDVVTSCFQDDRMDVGIRELKRRLSEYLDRAARGEVILVTDRGRPAAEPA